MGTPCVNNKYMNISEFSVVDPFYPENNPCYLSKLQTYRDWLINVYNDPQKIDACLGNKCCEKYSYKTYSNGLYQPVGHSCTCKTCSTCYKGK